jgi:hypothetical protein
MNRFWLALRSHTTWESSTARPQDKAFVNHEYHIGLRILAVYRVIAGKAVKYVRSDSLDHLT